MDASMLVVERSGSFPGHVAQADLTVHEGEVLLEVERFSLTTNNVTYAVTGDLLRYWSFFPTTDDEATGIVPVWGFATVAESRHADVAVGERWYGYLPMGTHVVVRPGRVDATGVRDASPHREGLAGTYQRYERVDVDPLHDDATTDLEALLRPLFSTAFLLDDLVTDPHATGGEVATVVITSASSKTSTALATLLARRPDVAVVGVTSERSLDGVRGSGVYDEVVAYGGEHGIEAGGPAVLVDVAGRAATVEATHEHYGHDLRLSLVVGVTHAGTGARPSAGPSPTPFFAPARAGQRARDWGAGVLGQRLAEAWRPYVAAQAERLSVREVHGLDAAVDEWASLVAGDVDPSEGIIVVPGG